MTSTAGKARWPRAMQLEVLDRLEPLREEWRSLAEAAGNVFTTWEWCSLWWGHHGGDRPLLLLACRRPSGELAALWPLYAAARRPVAIARLLGHGVAPLNGPVCAPADRSEAWRALGQALRDGMLGVDTVLADFVVPGDAASGARRIRREASPVLDLRGLTWDDFLAGRSPKLRAEVRRRERKLRDAHAIDFRLATDPDRLDQDFETVAELHDARWEGRSEVFAGAEREFHREFARAALDRGWLRLWLLEVEGRAVAGWYGFRFGDAEWFRQTGRDPDWEKWGVGFVLLTHTIREAIADGVGTYHFLRGDQSYKRRLASGDQPVECLALGRGLRGRAMARLAGRLVDPWGRRSLRAVVRGGSADGMA